MSPSAPKKFQLGLLIAILLIQYTAYSQTDLWRFYSNATNLAWEWDEVRYLGYDAEQWGMQYFQEHARLTGERTLQQHYQSLSELALSLPLRLAPQQADIWAKNFILQKYCAGQNPNIVVELQEFIAALNWEPGEAKKWVLNFLTAPIPFYSEQPILQCHKDISNFLRLHPEFVYTQTQADNLAHKFITNRYHFCGDLTLLSQCHIGYDYAVSLNGLGLSPDSAKLWAEKWVEERGWLNPQSNLNRQYFAAYQYAQIQLKLTHEQAQTWAIAFLIRKAQFSPQQSLMDQYQESFLFAYNSNFLPIFHQRHVPQGHFLHIAAMEWAKSLIQQRGRLNHNENLSMQYREAFILAYSTFLVPQEMPPMEDLYVENNEPAPDTQNNEPAPDTQNNEPAPIPDNNEPVTNLDNAKPVANPDNAKPVTNPDNAKPAPDTQNNEPAPIPDNNEPVTNPDTQNGEPVLDGSPIGLERPSPEMLQQQDEAILKQAPIMNTMSQDEARAWARDWMTHKYWP